MKNKKIAVLIPCYNESKTIEITDTSVLNAIKAGSVKGFGLQSSYSKSTYAVCSGACTVKITYVG